jgi:phospholipid/cholesterol/gamma-HCH transport system substrate-binding protein
VRPDPDPAATADAALALNAAARPQNRWLLALVLLGAAVLTALLAGGIAWRRGAFAPAAVLYALVDNAAGLSIGTAVRLSGVRVGEVSALDLQPDLSVRVAMRIDADLMQHMRSDAGAVLIREQLRPAVIELERGGAPTPLDPRNPKIAFRGRATLTEIADDIRSRLVPILDDLKQVSGSLRARQGDIAAVIANAASASGELARASADVHAVTTLARDQLGGLGSQTQALLAQGNSSVAKVGSLIDQVGTSLGVVNTALPGLLAKADSTLATLNAVAQDGRQITSAAAATLPGVLRAAPPMVEDAQDLLLGVRRSWAVRNLLPPAPPSELPVQSHDAGVLRNAAPR